MSPASTRVLATHIERENMSKRSQKKQVTTANRALKFLRKQARLSIRAASKRAGIGEGVINHLENGRIQIHERHLAKLLPVYGVTSSTYEMFASGQVKMPQDMRNECIEMIKDMMPEQLRSAHLVLASLVNQK